MHTFLAATIGAFRDHVKPPPKAGRLGRSGMSRLSSRLFRALSAPIRFASDVSGRLRSGRSGRTTRGAGAAGEAPVAMFMPEDNIIYGTGGWRFHHDQFAAALATPEHRALADTLIHTKLWTVCSPSPLQPPHSSPALPPRANRHRPLCRPCSPRCTLSPHVCLYDAVVNQTLRCRTHVLHACAADSCRQQPQPEPTHVRAPQACLHATAASYV